MLTPTVLLVIALAAGFYMAWNIGANDVANAMGTSVGSGALTLRKAIILAGIFEFCGAFFVGSNVSDTIRKKIIDSDAFTRAAAVAPVEPGDAPGAGPAGSRPAAAVAPATSPTADEIAARKLALGMLAALLAAAIWLNVATFFGQPVSTTHAIIGAVIGFAVMVAGPGCVNWGKVGSVAASWLISPLAGGLMAFIIYRCVRRFVLSHRHPVQRAKAVVPLAFGAVVFVITLSILYKGLPRYRLDMPFWTAAPLAAFAAVAAAVPARVIVGRSLGKRRVRLHERYEVVESWFGRIQPVTASFMAFAHGANDVANSIGPLVAVYQYASTGAIAARSVVPPWMLAMGGVAIVIGLATYGYTVIEAVGRKITEITPTRGFSAEFATATTVLLCSKLGLPISTTFVLVGAVMGVGVARGFGAIDLRVIRRILTSWLITIPVSAFLAAVLYHILMAL